MRAIIIGAGRGSRLMPTTADTPKCYAEVRGKRILDWAIDAFHDNGIDEIAFIGGYRIEQVRDDYPSFLFRHNVDWQNNNILASLFFAQDLMDEPFVCCYSDILFKPEIIGGLLNNDDDIALSVDTAWLDRYTHRTEHPPDDAEKVTVQGGVVTRIDRAIPESEAHGEYTGVARFSTEGASRLQKHFQKCKQQYEGRPFREANTFAKAYLIHLFQDLIETGQRMVHVDSPGGYIEIDTQQDFEYARQNWS